jgi:hypothetical protein
MFAKKGRKSSGFLQRPGHNKIVNPMKQSFWQGSIQSTIIKSNQEIIKLFWNRTAWSNTVTFRHWIYPDSEKFSLRIHNLHSFKTRLNKCTLPPSCNIRIKHILQQIGKTMEIIQWNVTPCRLVSKKHLASIIRVQNETISRIIPTEGRVGYKRNCFLQ